MGQNGLKYRSKQIATCHCGGVAIELDLPNGFENLRRCDCSMCRRKGIVVASVALAGLRITQGEEKLTAYRFNTRTAVHYFCSVCGIHTHHQRRSDPSEYGFNIACIDAVDIRDFLDAPVFDGVNHPANRTTEH